MADKLKRVAYLCNWCGLDFHDVDEKYSMRPIPIYNDEEGKQYCSIYCLKMNEENKDR